MVGEHLVALEVDTALSTGRVELRRGHRVRVLHRPDSELRVVVELDRVDEEVVRTPAAGRVARGRHRDALVERPCPGAVEGDSKPSIAARTGRRARSGSPVPCTADQATALLGRACSPGSAQRAACPSCCRWRSGGCSSAVVVVRADVALGVGRVAPAEVVDALEVLDRRRHLTLRRASLHDRVYRAAPWGRCVRTLS